MQAFHQPPFRRLRRQTDLRDRVPAPETPRGGAEGSDLDPVVPGNQRDRVRPRHLHRQAVVDGDSGAVPAAGGRRIGRAGVGADRDVQLRDTASLQVAEGHDDRVHLAVGGQGEVVSGEVLLAGAARPVLRVDRHRRVRRRGLRVARRCAGSAHDEREVGVHASAGLQGHPRRASGAEAPEGVLPDGGVALGHGGVPVPGVAAGHVLRLHADPVGRVGQQGDRSGQRDGEEAGRVTERRRDGRRGDETPWQAARVVVERDFDLAGSAAGAVLSPRRDLVGHAGRGDGEVVRSSAAEALVRIGEVSRDDAVSGAVGPLVEARIGRLGGALDATIRLSLASIGDRAVQDRRRASGGDARVRRDG